jgi:hypothetical protein
MSGIGVIQSFVEGTLSSSDFEEKIYSDADLEKLLKAENDLPAYVGEVDLYTYAISQNFKSFESVFNLQMLLSSVLNKSGISHSIAKKYEKLFNLSLKAQPKWLSFSPEYLSKVVEGKEHLTLKDLQLWLKDKIITDFRCLKAAPKWLQNPDWPLVDNKPLVFVGQLDISGLSHDNAQAYLFFDEDSGVFTTITQAC